MPLSVPKQVVILYAAVNGYLADIDNKDVQAFCKGLVNHIENNAKEIFEEIRIKKDFDKETEENIIKNINDYKTIFKA